MKQRDRGGFIAIEFVASVALLLVPVVLLVASLPSWSQREYAATVAARDGARFAARVYPDDGRATAADLAARVAESEGVPRSDVTVDVTGSLVRGGSITVRVTVVMPGLAAGMFGGLGGWRWTAAHTEPIDEYASA